MLLMASLPFNMFYSHIILISYTIHSLIHLNKNSIRSIFSFRTLALQSVFFVTVLSSIYSINPSAAFDEWGKHLTILLFPLLFCINPVDIKKYRPQLLLAFAFACTATIIYLYYDTFTTIHYYKLPFSKLFSPSFTNHNFSEPLSIHATFFSMQLVVALVYLLSLLIEKGPLHKKLPYLICSIILIAGIIQLSSKSIFITLLIAINIAIPYFLLRGKKRLRFIIISTSITVFAIVAIFNSGVFKERYVAELRNDLSKSIHGAPIDSRLSRWEVAIELIKTSPVIGYGAGSEIGLLQESFFNKKLFNSYLNRLNAHSEYLSFLLKSGIIGLLAYLSTLVFGFNIALKRKDLIFFTFMTMIAIISLSENLLDVDKGIFFYAFFFSFFAFSTEGVVRIFVKAKKPVEVISEESEVLS